jgi:hypothetical protein
MPLRRRQERRRPAPSPAPASGVRLSPPVHAPRRAPVTPPVTPAENGHAPAPETITLSVVPDEAPAVDEAFMRHICDMWNDLERPSLTQTCLKVFGSKNSQRLAIVRRAIRWGREQGLIEWTAMTPVRGVSA